MELVLHNPGLLVWDPPSLEWIRRLGRRLVGEIMGALGFYYYGGGGGFAPVVKQAGPAAPGASRQFGSALLGWQGGRLMRYSDERGAPLPPAHVTNRLVVAGYADGSETGDGFAYVLASKTAAPSYAASGAQTSDSPAYFGPAFDTVYRTAVSGSRLYPTTDWSVGLPAVIYDSAASGSGAAGQYAFVKGRPAQFARRFQLFAPFRVAPEAGDLVCLGGAPMWVQWGEQAAQPMRGSISIRGGEIVLRRLDDALLEVRVEIYPSGNSQDIAAPEFPFQPDGLGRNYHQRDLHHRGTLHFAFSNSAGRGANSRAFSVALARLADRGDFALTDFNYEVAREARPEDANNG